MAVHYADTAFPRTVTDGFLDFFEGLTHVPLNYSNIGPSHYQESAYWTINLNAYKFGLPNTGSSYYFPYGANDNLSLPENARDSDYTSVTSSEEALAADGLPERDASPTMDVIPEECSPIHPSTNSSQEIWQDDIDPDGMTYEELLDLGEAVGMQSRGLPEELINSLPTSKYRPRFFSKKRYADMCVICQMKYRIAEKLTKLPCNHVYHHKCLVTWLGINKICPICFREVFVERPKDAKIRTV